MQHVFSVGGNSITFRASPFVSYNHPQMEQPTDPTPKEPTPPPPPPPPQQKLLIKLRVSDLGSGSSSGAKTLKQNGTSDEEEVDEQPLQVHDEAPVKRRGGGPGSRGKRRKVDQGPGTPTSDDGLSVAWDSSASATPTKRGGRGGKGSRGGAGRGRGGRKSGLQHQVLPVPIPGTPDSAGELSLRPASPSSESTSNVALTPTPISTPTIPIPTPVLPAPQPPTPSEIDPALLATAPRRPLPTRAFPVQPAPKTNAATPIVGNGGIDWNKRRVRRWGVKMREVRGVGGGSWWVRTWVGSSESEYASDPARILSVPTTLPRSSSTTSLTTTKQRKSESSWGTKQRKTEARSGTLSTEPAIKVEPSSSSSVAAGTSHYRDQEGVELLTAFATSGGGGGGGSSTGGGIGANHYREREFNHNQSSGASTPNVSAPKVKYDLARDGIEEVVPPESVPMPEGSKTVRGVGKPVPYMPNGSAKGKGKAVENGPPVAEDGAGAGGDARARSGSGYEQAARDVEMELMGET